MGNKQTSENRSVFIVENTGIENVETPHFRNIVCLNENNGELIENIWDVNTCHELFMYVIFVYDRYIEIKSLIYFFTGDLFQSMEDFHVLVRELLMKMDKEVNLNGSHMIMFIKT